ncbi:MAG: TRAP transporter small permease subunit [Rhodobacteraceae bacterium]|nr:TRAP transporter small permease subunit [Paracoccaceae bacterium]
MTNSSFAVPVMRHDRNAPFIRIFGWGMLAVMAGFLINNVLIVGYGFTGISGLWSGNAEAAMLASAVYMVCLGTGIGFVLLSSGTALRFDSNRIHRFNVFLIRWAFWVVLLVGVVDSMIAFFRVEGFLFNWMSEDTARAFGRPRDVGMTVHMPLVMLAFLVAIFTRTLGFTWLALMIVVAELLIVISRFVFSYEQALMGDLVRYWYAALFLFASAYTLFDEGHVRVDVLYAGFKGTTRGLINAFGSITLGLTTCWVIIWVGFNGERSIINSPVMNFEITQTGGVGMFVKYQMAAFLGVFAITMLIQFISYFFEAVADYRDEPGHREHTPAAH